MLSDLEKINDNDGFNEYIKKFNLRKKATSIIKIQQVLNSIGLNKV